MLLREPGQTHHRDALETKLRKTTTELEFELRLKREHPTVTVLYEPLKLRIDDTDFWIPEMITFFEVKGGHAWEDSIVKFKAARAIHTWAKFEMHQKKLGVWRQIRNLPHGS